MSCNSSSVSNTDTAAPLRMMQHRHGINKKLQDSIAADDGEEDIIEEDKTQDASDSKGKAPLESQSSGTDCNYMNNVEGSRLKAKCETCKSKCDDYSLSNKERNKACERKNDYCEGWIDVPCVAPEEYMSCSGSGCEKLKSNKCNEDNDVVGIYHYEDSLEDCKKACLENSRCKVFFFASGVICRLHKWCNPDTSKWNAGVKYFKQGGGDPIKTYPDNSTETCSE